MDTYVTEVNAATDKFIKEELKSVHVHISCAHVVVSLDFLRLLN